MNAFAAMVVEHLTEHEPSRQVFILLSRGPFNL